MADWLLFCRTTLPGWQRGLSRGPAREAKGPAAEMLPTLRPHEKLGGEGTKTSGEVKLEKTRGWRRTQRSIARNEGLTHLGEDVHRHSVPSATKLGQQNKYIWGAKRRTEPDQKNVSLGEIPLTFHSSPGSRFFRRFAPPLNRVSILRQLG